MAILLHGTTRRRAEQILANGPDPEFIEPGGGTRAEGFSTCLEAGPFPVGSPEEYARRKAAAFPGWSTLSRRPREVTLCRVRSGHVSDRAR